MKERRVLIIQRRMTEYRVPLFEALRARLAASGVTLQVAYGRITEAEETRDDAGVLPWGIQSSCHYPFPGSSNLVWQHIPGHLMREQDLIIVPHENILLLNYLLLFRHRWLKRTRLAFWGHGANFQSLAPNGLRERLKAWTARQADWWFAYTSLSVERLAAHGFPVRRISCLNNSIDTSHLRQWRAQVSEGERRALLAALGLQGGRLAVFLGSLSTGKRLKFTFGVAEHLRRLFADFELLIVGDGPQRDSVQEFAATRPWCRWVGARHGREKALYLSLARVMLNPGLVGLNLIDSFALGIPLLTTDCGIHSPEIAYLDSGKNGLMTPDEPKAFADAAAWLLADDQACRQMGENCRRDAEKFSIENMVANFSAGILDALAPDPAPQPLHVVVIWQRFLFYHAARLRHLNERLSRLGYRLSAIEVASQDGSYGFAQVEATGFAHHCCFPGSCYHDHKTDEIHGKVRALLASLQPDVVFAPATPFPEGMAADAHRLQSGCRRVMMDDAWEHTDRRGRCTRLMKRLIHRNVDAVFIPAPSHLAYYQGLGFPRERVLYGVDVVDNDYYQTAVDQARRRASGLRAEKSLPADFFLFVGRFLPRKGVETLLAAYASYRAGAEGKTWDLVLVGDGPHLEAIEALAAGIPGVHLAGVARGDDLCHYYALARALVVPSVLDPWGLVVNEGLAAALPVLVSSGCGAARTLVREGENGWTFAPQDSDCLAGLMERLSGLSEPALARMGERSREIAGDWSLDRFADGVVEAIALSRREDGGWLSNLATRLWKGRVSVN
jgi:L-malate glycosyltransferase